jgi:hypothetical protein
LAGNFEQTSTTQDSTDSAESSAVTDLYDFRWQRDDNEQQVLMYREKNSKSKGKKLTLDLDGGNPEAGERSRTQITSNSTVKVNINGKIYSVPLGEIKPATTPAWGSGDNVIPLNNETQIATNPSTNDNGASTLTNAITAFTDTGSTMLSSGINNTVDTTPTTLAAT